MNQSMNGKLSTPERAAAIVAWIAIVGGAVARTWALTQRGSLWLDEASLALNVLTRGFGGLLHPLDWGQAAPVGFLWLERAIAMHAETPDVFLRLLPWAAGVLLPWLLWELGRRFVGTAAGAFAAVAASGSMLALRYSTEAKPYSTDAAVAAALMLLAYQAGDAPRERWRWWLLGGGIVLAVMLSLPSVFVIAALVAALAMDPEVRRSRDAQRIALPALGAAVLLFGLLWVSAYGAGASSAALRSYWAPVMLSVTAHDFVIRVVRVLEELTWIPLRWTGSLLGTIVGTLLWGLGLVVVGRRRRSAAVLLAGPIACAMVASALGVYPLSDRLAFFAVPGVWVAQAAALVGIRNAMVADRTTLSGSRAAAVFVVLVAFGSAAWQYTDAERFLRDPGSLEPSRALFAKVDADAATTPIYVYARSVPAWLMATHDGAWTGNPRLERWTALAGRVSAPGFENMARSGAVAPGAGDSLVVVSGARTELVGLPPGVEYRITGAPSGAGPSVGWAAAEAQRMLAAAHPEVWLVASHFFGSSPANELRPLVEAAAAVGLRVMEERHEGADVVALRLSR